MSDVEVGTILFESLIVELLSIVGNKCMGKSKAVNNRFSKEFSDLSLSNVS